MLGMHRNVHGFPPKRRPALKKEMDMTNAPPAAEETDALDGGQEFADFLSKELGKPVPRKRAYYLVRKKIIPGGHLGEGHLLGSKRAIRERLQSIARGEA
jgi:hypothetical protein